VALELTKPLTEMSTRILPGGKRRPARKADNLTAMCEPIVLKMLEPRRLTTRRASTACYRDSFSIFPTRAFAIVCAMLRRAPCPVLWLNGELRSTIEGWNAWNSNMARSLTGQFEVTLDDQ
jgi:hypothetical protein